MNIVQLGMLIQSRTGWPYLADVLGAALYMRGFDLKCTVHDDGFVRVVERHWTPGYIYYSDPIAIWAGDLDYLIDRLTIIHNEGCHALRLH